MRVVVAPDSFGGTLSAVEAADAIAAGWRAVAPGDDVDVVPLSDGGPGFVDVLAAGLGGTLLPVDVPGPLGARVTARLLLCGDTAYVESAAACGLHLVPPAAPDPAHATTEGVGRLVTAALWQPQVRRIVVGLGGSATNDGGAGMLRALGLRLLDAAGARLPGADVPALGRLARADPRQMDPRLAAVGLVAASDVDNPLLGSEGATAVYGPQKGVPPDQVLALDAALARYAEVLGRDLPGAAGREQVPGAGAAGGLGYGLIVLGATRLPGIATVLDVVRLDERIADTGLVLTGEGSFDLQSLRGKVVSGVAAAAMAAGVPCVVLAGRVDVAAAAAADTGVAAAYSLVESAGSAQAAVSRAGPELSHLAARLAARWKRSRWPGPEPGPEPGPGRSAPPRSAE